MDQEEEEEEEDDEEVVGGSERAGEGWCRGCGSPGAHGGARLQARPE